MESYIKTAKLGTLGTITFYSSMHNAMTNAMLQEMNDAIIAFSVDEEVKVILLRSEGEKVFCAGASFSELKSIRSLEEAHLFFGGFAKVINSIRKSSKIVVCRVQGKAVGGGVGLAAAADYTIATALSSIRLSELMIGIGPYVIGPAVVRKLGVASFQKMCLTPDQVRSAEWAYSHCIYQEYFESVAQMDDFIKDYVAKVGKYPLESIRGIKQMFWHGTEDWDDLLTERVKTVSELLLTVETQGIIQGL
jgi:methylglutaconyl-CoA hydratase